MAQGGIASGASAGESNFPGLEAIVSELAVPTTPAARPRLHTSKGVISVSLQEHNFPSIVSDFCFHSIYTKHEAINALSKVNAECLRVAEMRLLNTTVSKSVRLEEFEGLQNSAMVQINHYLKDAWVANLKTAVQSSLSHVGKGWYNLEETNREVYMFSKLRRLMSMINFRMEDSVRFLVMSSLKRYQQMLRKASAFEVVVRDTDDVEVAAVPLSKQDLENEHAEPSGFDLNGPLFAVGLTVKDNRISYKKEPRMFLETPLTIIDKALLMLLNIPRLETQVMEHLFSYGGSDVPKLASVLRGEPWVCDVYDSIRRDLSNVVRPLEQYLATMEKYNSVLELDVDKYVDELKLDEKSLEQTRRELNSHLEAIELVKKRVPSTAHLGVVVVSCEDVQKRLIAKHQLIIQKELDAFSNFTKGNATAAANEFKSMEKELKRHPHTVDGLQEIKAYMATVSAAVRSKQSAIQSCLESFDLMDTFKVYTNAVYATLNALDLTAVAVF